MSKNIEDILPREQSGSNTGKRFDYQYDRAAEECLSLLEDDGAVSILCEWHDDYVSEHENGDCDTSLYCFFQVKTKDSHLSPWEFKDLFGLPSSKRKPARGKEKEQEEKNNQKCKASIVGRMYEHFINFGSRCHSVVLVSNTGVDKNIQKLIGTMQNVGSVEDIESDELFNDVFQSFSKAFKATRESMISFLKSVVIQSDSARLGKSTDDMNTTMMGKILDLSEIELNIKDARAIGKELVDLVRDKSKEVIGEAEIPLSKNELRKRKGVVVRDVLKLLSLSASAYDELKSSGDKNIVRSISRFHRLCKNTGMPESLIPRFCKIKTKWDIWRREYRTNMDDQDELSFTTFTGECERIISLHSSGNLDFSGIGREAGQVAKDYKEILIGSSELTAEIVTGYIFALIAEKE